MQTLAMLGVWTLLGCLPTHLPVQPASGGGSSIIPLPGGVAESNGRIGYVASASGGIEALDLVTGDVLWNSLEAQTPVLVADDRLYAQAGLKRNRLRILVYDLTRKGEVVLESDPVVFPDWVVTGAAPGRSFQAEWRLEKDALMLSWQAQAWYHGKTKPTSQMEAEARKSAEGCARIDLVSGKIKMLPATPHAVRIGAAVPTKELEKKAIRWQGTVNGQFKAVLLEQDAQGQKLVLAAWDPLGVSLGEPKVLLTGKRLTVMATLDERIICVREMLPSPDQRPIGSDRQKYAWSLIALETGELVARVAFEPSTQSLMILGSRLLVLQASSITGSLNQPAVSARILKAIDLQTGRFLWQRNVAGRTIYPPER